MLAFLFSGKLITDQIEPFTTNNIFSNCNMVSESVISNRHHSMVQVFCWNWHCQVFGAQMVVLDSPHLHHSRGPSSLFLGVPKGEPHMFSYNSELLANFSATDI